jgi:STE24 endopeptidase
MVTPDALHTSSRSQECFFMIRSVSLVIAALALVALSSAGSLQSACAADTPSSVAASGHFDVDAATAAYLATMTPAARARSDAYFEGGYWLVLWDFLFGLLLA